MAQNFNPFDKQISMEHTPDFKSNWDKWKEQVKKEYPDMTEEELLYELDKDTELLKKLQVKTGKTKEEIFDWLHLMG